MTFPAKRISRQFNTLSLGDQEGFDSGSMYMGYASNDLGCSFSGHREMVRSLQRIGLPGGFQD